MKRKTYTKEDYEEAKRLRRELGYSYAEISRLLGPYETTVRAWCLGIKKPYSVFTEKEMQALNEKKSKAKRGSLNPNWKDNEVTEGTTRQRLQRDMPVPKGHERHHIDGNGRNSDTSNILILTRRGHMIEDGRMEALIERNKRGHSPEAIEKIRKTWLGRKHRPESIEKMRKIKLGKKPSPETREKIRQKALERWARWKREGRPFKNKTLSI